MRALQQLKSPLIKASWLVDILLFPFSILAACWLWLVRRFGICRLPKVRKGLEAIGIFPLRYQYYEGLFYQKDLIHPLTRVRNIVGLKLNESEQLQFIQQFNFADELKQIPFEPTAQGFYYHNQFFEAGDAEIFYNILRHYKPQRLIEIGCGWSTHLAQQAIRQNTQEDTAYQCHHVCIEPFEHPELEQMGVELIRQKVEQLPLSTFDALESGDILFIDSSHVIKPQGDVLFEILQILGHLKPGVLIHIHDIYTPRDYREGSLIQSQIFWNEQYLLEAFLCFNDHFKVRCALNHLYKSYPEHLSQACPILSQMDHQEPCSFWIEKVA